MNCVIVQPMLITRLPRRPETSWLFPSLVTFTVTDRTSLPETRGSHRGGGSNNQNHVKHAPVTKTPEYPIIPAQQKDHDAVHDAS